MIYLCMISIKKYILYLYFSNPLVIVVNYFWMTWDKMVVSSCQLSKNLPFFKLFKERIQLLPSVSFKNSSRILWRSSWNVSQNNEWEFRYCCLMEMVFFKMYSKKIVSHPYSRVCIFKTLNVISFQNYTYLQTYSNVQILA